MIHKTYDRKKTELKKKLEDARLQTPYNVNPD